MSTNTSWRLCCSETARRPVERNIQTGERETTLPPARAVTRQKYTLGANSRFGIRWVVRVVVVLALGSRLEKAASWLSSKTNSSTPPGSVQANMG
jgi:hypothetical protein